MNQIEKKINRKSIFKKNCRAAVLQKFFALLSFSLVAEGCLSRLLPVKKSNHRRLTSNRRCRRLISSMSRRDIDNVFSSYRRCLFPQRGKSAFLLGNLSFA
jgi:hypothetical protein